MRQEIFFFPFQNLSLVNYHSRVTLCRLPSSTLKASYTEPFQKEPLSRIISLCCGAPTVTFCLTVAEAAWDGYDFPGSSRWGQPEAAWAPRWRTPSYPAAPPWEETPRCLGRAWRKTSEPPRCGWTSTGTSCCGAAGWRVARPSPH